MLRTVQSLPLCRAFDTGLRPDPFPDRAASLLPGLLAATRTGLPPASDDELTTADQPPTRSTSCLLGARERLTGPAARGRILSGVDIRRDESVYVERRTLNRARTLRVHFGGIGIDWAEMNVQVNVTRYLSHVLGQGAPGRQVRHD